MDDVVCIIEMDETEDTLSDATPISHNDQQSP